MKPKSKAKKNPAAVALGKLGNAKLRKTMTPEQISEQNRRSVSCRRDRQKAGPWYGLLVFPADYEWRGTAHAATVIDEIHANPQVLFWSQNKAEVIARARQSDLRDRLTDIIEQDWDPRAFTIKRGYQPDAGRQLKALHAVLDSEGGRP